MYIKLDFLQLNLLVIFYSLRVFLIMIQYYYQPLINLIKYLIQFNKYLLIHYKETNLIKLSKNLFYHLKSFLIA